MEFWFDFSLFFQIGTEFLPLILLLLFNKKVNLPLSIYLWASFVASLLITITVQLHLKNLVIFNFYFVISLTSLSAFYYNLINLKKIKFIIPILYSICLGVFIWEIIYTDLITFCLIIEKFCVVIFSLLAFAHFLGQEKKSESLILINSSLLIYSSFGLLFTIEIDHFLITNYWFIHNLIDGLSKLLIAYAIWKIPKTYPS
jgi:hypothetical protein